MSILKSFDIYRPLLSYSDAFAEVRLLKGMLAGTPDH